MFEYPLKSFYLKINVEEETVGKNFHLSYFNLHNYNLVMLIEFNFEILLINSRCFYHNILFLSHIEVMWHTLMHLMK